MPIRRIVVGVLMVLASGAAQAADRIEPYDGYTGSSLALWQRAAAEPATMRLLEGDDAPTFSYLGDDGAWHRFSDIARGQPVVLVFGAREDDLVELESGSSWFREMGITCVVVMDRRAGSARSVARKVGLTATVVADPKCAIGDLYNSIHPLNHRHTPSWFVLDGHRRVRALGHGEVPTSLDLLRSSSRALGLPLPDSVVTTVNG